MEGPSTLYNPIGIPVVQKVMRWNLTADAFSNLGFPH